MVSPADFYDRLMASPLSWPIREAMLRLPDARAGLSVEALDHALGPLSQVRFVPARPRAELSYDAAIVLHGVVPTRPGGLHDLMNALVWATFPASKRALHTRQLRLVRERLDGEGRRVLQNRSPEGDGVAMIDEGGIVVLARDAEPLRASLERRDVEPLRRAVGAGDARCVVFGHALYEHIARGSGTLVWGKTVVFSSPLGSASPLQEADALLSDHLASSPPAAFLDAGNAPLTCEALGS